MPTKKFFIEIADAIREHNRVMSTRGTPFTTEHLETLADVLKASNSNFNRERWMEYVSGACGQNGGARKS